MWTVYKHTMPDGKCYIGITKFPVEQRWGINGENYLYQYKMKHAILKYGWDNIQHEILETDISSEEEARQKETAYIQIFDSLINGYNSKFSLQEEQEKIPKETYLYSFPVLQLNYLTGEIIHKYSCIKEAAIAVNVAATNIKSVCLKQQLTCRGYAWCFEKDYDNWQKTLKRTIRPCVCIETQITYPNVTACAKDLKTHPTNILNCLNGKNITHHGFHFAYADEYSTDWQPRKKKRLPRPAEMKNGRSIPVYCEETDTTYPSATDCANAIPGITRTAVYHCCNGRSKKVFKKNTDGTKTPYHVRWVENLLEN